MLTFLKTQVASIIGSLVDFLITILLVQVWHTWYVAGNFVGNVSGAMLQFLLCKDWVFKTKTQNQFSPLIKFLFVWIGNLLLSAAGVFLLTNFAGLNYIISKIITSFILGTTYNYLLLKKFVFV